MLNLCNILSLQSDFVLDLCIFVTFSDDIIKQIIRVNITNYYNY